MRVLKKIGIILLSIVFLVLLFGYLYVQHLKPSYNGKLKLKNIMEQVDVFYDDIGVPHIYAQNQKDAYITLGYVHAQDRLWQMELIRRIAAGRLTEIFGKDKEKDDELIFKTDKFFIGLGIEDAAIRMIKNLDTTSQSYILAKAYLNGINQFVDDGPTPIEYKVIGVKKEKFTLKDMYNVFGYMSFSFAAAHKTDPLLSKMKENLDPKYLLDLDITIDTTKTTKMPSYNLDQGIQSNIVAQVSNIMDNLPVSPFIGSNSWVVGPQKTASGKVIFANDPHIAFSQPAVWYQSHIVCPDFEIYGFNLALTPFPLLGHNRNYAYGLTMFENDDIDFYSEKTNPENANEYALNGKYVPFLIKEKVIKVKKGKTESFNIKIGTHGPIMNGFIDLIDDENPIAMDWVYTKFNNKMLMASYELSHATNMKIFKEGVSKIHAPGLNVMYGDAQDNFAWFAAGKLYTHDNKVNTKFILNAENGDDKLTYLNFEQNPQAINPLWNYVYSANNQPDEIESGFYPGYYLPENRAKRIVNQLKNKNEITVDHMKDLINDVTSSMAPKLITEIISNISEENLSNNETTAIKILKNWDGSYNLNQVVPTIYTKLEYQLYKNIYEDELGKKGFQQFLNTHLSKRQYNKHILSNNSIWFDDINSLDFVETKQHNIIKSFKETIKFLEEKHGVLISKWKWENAISVTHEHPIGDKLNFLGLHFNVGPFKTSGGNEVLNNQIFDLNGDGVYKVKGGPSTRRIVDFNNIENSFAILPTGQSGNIFSKHYNNQAQHYLDGKFFKMLLNKEEIQQFKDKLVITPK